MLIAPKAHANELFEPPLSKMLFSMFTLPGIFESGMVWVEVPLIRMFIVTFVSYS